MKKEEIAKGMAADSGMSEAEAADRLDSVVHEIVTKLRKGEQAPLPGLGRFVRSRDGIVRFRKEARKR